MRPAVCSTQDFIDTVRANPINAELLKCLPAAGLDQCYLTAGCLFQSTWNRLADKPLGWGVKDYDIFYFDGNDLSYEAENAAIQRIQSLIRHLDITIEVKNQARVHLWYRQRFQTDYPPLTSSRDGIDRYPIAGTCVGIEVATGRLYAPHGLQDIYDGMLRLNPANSQPVLFRAKAASYRSRWPWLRMTLG